MLRCSCLTAPSQLAPTHLRQTHPVLAQAPPALHWKDLGSAKEGRQGG